MSRVTTRANVLVINDDPAIVDVMRMILSRERDDRVTLAHSGRSGLAIAEHDQPDLILCGIAMPELDGYQTFRRLRRIPGIECTPIILIAARPDAWAGPMSRACGAAGYIAYPFRPKDLLRARDAALGGETYYEPDAEPANQASGRR